jgi:hypothetical protein
MKMGAAQIFRHAFFKTLKWDEVYAQSSPALFRPSSSGNKFDMSNFDEYEDEDVHNVVCEVTEQEQRMFADFT